jgi:hypothetical protein
MISNTLAWVIWPAFLAPCPSLVSAPTNLGFRCQMVKVGFVSEEEAEIQRTLF